MAGLPHLQADDEQNVGVVGAVGDLIQWLEGQVCVDEAVPKVRGAEEPSSLVPRHVGRQDHLRTGRPCQLTVCPHTPTQRPQGHRCPG